MRNKEKRSPYEIAELFGISHMTVRRANADDAKPRPTPS